MADSEVLAGAADSEDGADGAALEADGVVGASEEWALATEDGALVGLDHGVCTRRGTVWAIDTSDPQ